jgi:GH15 family glucan-1,4-alpha-glucosidase
MNPPQSLQPSLNLGVIGNCAYSALIDERGGIVWSCLPRFDGDPVFNALLDPSDAGSRWAVELEDFARSEQQYEPNTAILRTRLFDSQASASS